jgi:dihydrofolate synthase/folylpolyglutamate synthase
MQGRPSDYTQAEKALLARWPETRIEPSLDRIRAAMAGLRHPERAFRSVHVTGTNGKTSTARILERLLMGFGYRVGRFSSPHLVSLTERISLDCEPLTRERFASVFATIEPALIAVDRDHDSRMSFFEAVTVMAYSTFARSDVDVAVVEVCMGGRWDVTNVIESEVAVLTPIAIDHERYLGTTVTDIANEKVGIIKRGATVVTAVQSAPVMDIIAQRCHEQQARLVVAGVDIEGLDRHVTEDGQSFSLRSGDHRYDDLRLPMRGQHQMQNAAFAVAAVEALTGDRLRRSTLIQALADCSSPGRLELIDGTPTVVIDAAHNPHGAHACAQTLVRDFDFQPLVGVLAVMADKDYEGILRALEPVLTHVVCTQNGEDRSLGAQVLASAATNVFGAERVTWRSELTEALAHARQVALDSAATTGRASPGVLVTGSVVTAGHVLEHLSQLR